MPTISNSTAFVRHDRVVANDLGEQETVMLDVDRGMYFGLTGVGRAIWDRLAEPISLDDLVGSLLEEYDVAESACREEVRAFLADLVEEGLVDATEPAGGS